MKIKAEQWQIDVWLPGMNRWEKIATAVSEGVAEEIVASLEECTGDDYRVLVPPIDYGR